jgi:colanic acid biosynthesis protein WcaH
MNKEKYEFSDYDYGKVLDNFVIACVDVVVLHNSNVLLEHRVNNPIRNEWWILGGRVRKGESLTEAAQRGLLAEIGLNIVDKTRLKQVGTFNLVWPTRREPNPDNGCHQLLVAHAIEINNAEYMLVNKALRNNMKWFSVGDIESEKFLPELRDVIDHATRGKTSLNLTSVR